MRDTLVFWKFKDLKCPGIPLTHIVPQYGEVEGIVFTIRNPVRERYSCLRIKDTDSSLTSKKINRTSSRPAVEILPLLLLFLLARITLVRSHR